MKINPETSSRFASSKVFNISKKENVQGICLDIDIVLEGNAERFAELIRKRNDTGFAINYIKIHKRFRTASIEFLINKKPLKVDLASARTETYLNHGALPAVSIGGTSLKDDVFRRDFTINTLSFSLNPMVRRTAQDCPVLPNLRFLP
jgi:tRNA nucleotidyltransferase/poly(A) polymerase